MANPPTPFNVASEQTIIGARSKVKGDKNTIIGPNSIVHGDKNSVFGRHLTVVGNDNIITGSKASITGNGNQYTGSGALIKGNGNVIKGDNCVIIGSGNRVTGKNNIVNGIRYGRLVSESVVSNIIVPSVAIEDTPALHPSRTCIVCLTNEPTCVALPCGHLAFCADCSLSLVYGPEHRTKRIKTAFSVCPKCRQKVEEFKHLHL